MSISILTNSPSLIALSILTEASARGVRRVGDTLRCKVLDRKITASAAPQLMQAVESLVRAGHSVRLFSNNVVVWTNRASRCFRKHAVVEVSL